VAAGHTPVDAITPLVPRASFENQSRDSHESGLLSGGLSAYVLSPYLSGHVLFLEARSGQFLTAVQNQITRH